MRHFANKPSVGYQPRTDAISPSAQAPSDGAARVGCGGVAGAVSLFCDSSRLASSAIFASSSKFLRSSSAMFFLISTSRLATDMSSGPRKLRISCNCSLISSMSVFILTMTVLPFFCFFPKINGSAPRTSFPWCPLDIESYLTRWKLPSRPLHLNQTCLNLQPKKLLSKGVCPQSSQCCSLNGKQCKLRIFCFKNSFVSSSKPLALYPLKSPAIT